MLFIEKKMKFIFISYVNNKEGGTSWKFSINIKLKNIKNGDIAIRHYLIHAYYIFIG
jgi:hypothetical protein